MVLAQQQYTRLPCEAGLAVTNVCMLFCCCTFPQVVCTQMQARANLKRQLASHGQSAAADAIRSDAMGVVGSIWQEDGPFGFWKGEGFFWEGGGRYNLI
jgi:hypothetical protein